MRTEIHRCAQIIYTSGSTGLPKGTGRGARERIVVYVVLAEQGSLEQRDVAALQTASRAAETG
jgi:acyl-coenzyme A synthetase/AMP-(fatty) acid ligase